MDPQSRSHHPSLVREEGGVRVNRWGEGEVYVREGVVGLFGQFQRKLERERENECQLGEDRSGASMYF